MAFTGQRPHWEKKNFGGNDIQKRQKKAGEVFPQAKGSYEFEMTTWSPVFRPRRATVPAGSSITYCESPAGKNIFG